MPDTATTIQISKQLRNQLAKLGSKDDTFETIIRKLLERVGVSK